MVAEVRRPSTGPVVAAATDSNMRGLFGVPVQRWRQFTQASFFMLFILAPLFDIFRLDLNLKHFIFMGFDWTLGLDAFVAGRASAGQAALNIVLRGFLPILAIGGTLIYVNLVVCGHPAGDLLRGTLGYRAADLFAAAVRNLRQPLAWHADAQPSHFPVGRQSRILRRVHVRPPSVLPLWLRGRAVPEFGVDGQR